MPQHGAYAHRNAVHKRRRARLLADAKDDGERLTAAFDWFRSSARLLARRRVPKGASQETHRAAAARLVREVTAYLKELAEAIDRGEHDAKLRGSAGGKFPSRNAGAGFHCVYARVRAGE